MNPLSGHYGTIQVLQKDEGEQLLRRVKVSIGDALFYLSELLCMVGAGVTFSSDRKGAGVGFIAAFFVLIVVHMTFKVSELKRCIESNPVNEA